MILQVIKSFPPEILNLIARATNAVPKGKIEGLYTHTDIS